MYIYMCVCVCVTMCPLVDRHYLNVLNQLIGSSVV